jgi:cytoplasmic iron level regulating protein YaaA (DUF328/UPF0246 family)
MFAIISPAKTLDYESPSKPCPAHEPEFLGYSEELIKILRGFDAQDLVSLMNVSEKIADLNVQRFSNWKSELKAPEARPAIYAFKGDVYEGLGVETLGADDLTWLNERMGILSGLYGLLRPMDLMLPYRLEMGTKLSNPRGKNLYAFWGQILRDNIQERMGANPLLVNLASNEYSKAAQLNRMDGVVVSPQFKDWKNGSYKIISFYAKRARGLMLRYMAQHRIDSAEGLEGFDLDDYCFNGDLSSALMPVFTRKKQ